ncbi:hypothetical protein IJE86_01185 [bacterium]|nr:hypothetical protein [bacterium]
MNFELNLSTEELLKRTSKDCLIPKKMLDVDSIEYNNLKQGDKEALKHLVLAAKKMDEVFMQQDNAANLAFKKYLESESKSGNTDAEMTLKLFNAQIGMVAVDSEANKIYLAKGYQDILGKGFYPTDLSTEEFHNILISMLNNGEFDEVRNILNQRTMVIRDNNKLKALDYTEYFRDEFTYIAKHLEKASEYSTNKDFNEYLKLQVKALLENNPMLDAYADKKWAELQDTPLEFTISREQYADELTGTVMENEQLAKLLDENNITPISKDSLGARVGIVNKAGTAKLLEIKKYLPLLAQNMPFSEQYEQNISADDDEQQTMVDVDIVTLRGDEGTYRGGITVAQNLPNNDKLSLTIGGGRRNVYHRQIRTSNSPEALEKRQKRLNATLREEFHKYYNPEADHWFTIGHENAHSLGPKSGTEALGKYKNIIEENKADMGALALLDILQAQGMYTEDEVKQIIVTYAADNFLKAQPNLSQAHRVRTVMQSKYFLEKGAVKLDENNLIDINIGKMIPTAKEMLAEIIKVQLSQDFNTGEKYVLDNFVWTQEMETISKTLKEIDKSLNGTLQTPLADKLAQETLN